MKQHVIFFSFLAILLATLSGCSVIADIFKAGIFVGILVVVVVVALIVFIFRKMAGRN